MLKEFRPEIGHLKEETERLENVGDQKLLYWQHTLPKVCKAKEWIEENEILIEALIYKPIRLEMNVRTPHPTKRLKNTTDNVL